MGKNEALAAKGGNLGAMNVHLRMAASTCTLYFESFSCKTIIGMTLPSPTIGLHEFAYVFNGEGLAGLEVLGELFACGARLELSLCMSTCV